MKVLEEVSTATRAADVEGAVRGGIGFAEDRESGGRLSGCFGERQLEEVGRVALDGQGVGRNDDRAASGGGGEDGDPGARYGTFEARPRDDRCENETRGE